MLKRSLFLAIVALMGTQVYALPEGGVVTSGAATVATQGNTVTVNVATLDAAIDWQQFNIAQHETVNFQMQQDGIVWNTVVGLNKPSYIDGTLIANGDILLMNHSGIFMGPTANIDVAGMMATSATYNETENTYYYAPGAGQIVSQGTIRLGLDGGVVFMGPSVSHTGKIEGKSFDLLLLIGDKGLEFMNALEEDWFLALDILDQDGVETDLGNGNASLTIGTPKVALYPVSINIQGVAHKTVQDTGTSLRLL